MNKVICGDCSEIIPQLPDYSIDLVMTSPPYNLGKFVRNSGKYRYPDYNGNNMDETEYREWLKSVIRLIQPKLKETGSVAWNMKYRFHDNECILPNWILEGMSYTLRNQIIWQYTGYTDVCKNKFYPSYEVVFILVKDKNKYYFNGNYATKGDVWKIPQSSASGEIRSSDHPAPFPKELVSRCINALCPPEGVVFDPFLGSGTTAMVAMSLGRKFIGIEIDPNFCELSQKRVGMINGNKIKKMVIQ